VAKRRRRAAALRSTAAVGILGAILMATPASGACIVGVDNVVEAGYENTTDYQIATRCTAALGTCAVVAYFSVNFCVEAKGTFALIIPFEVGDCFQATGIAGAAGAVQILGSAVDVLWDDPDTGLDGCSDTGFLAPLQLVGRSCGTAYGACPTGQTIHAGAINGLGNDAISLPVECTAFALGECVTTTSAAEPDPTRLLAWNELPEELQDLVNEQVLSAVEGVLMEAELLAPPGEVAEATLASLEETLLREWLSPAQLAFTES
jgi:hypothetical protein